MPHNTRRSERRTVSPLPVVGTSFVVALAFLIVAGSSHPAVEFGDKLAHPATMVWCILVAAQVALWSYLAGPAYKRAARYVESFRAHRRSMVADFLVLVVLFGIFIYAHVKVTEGFTPLVLGQIVKARLLNVLGFATLVPCLLGMRLVAIAARAEAAAGVNRALLDRFSTLRADLRWFLGSAATIIGAATLANGAFRNALNALNTAKAHLPAHSLPASEVLLYGGFSSGVLALFYLTSHDVFSRSGWALVAAAEPVGDDSANAWAEAQVRRSRLAEVMGIATSAVRAFQDGAAILTPFFGSGLALLMSST